MAGMHMDKGGAAAFAGFVKTVSLLKPKGLKELLLVLPPPPSSFLRFLH